MDEAISLLLESPDSVKKEHEVWTAFGEFSQAISKLVGRKTDGKKRYTFGSYGCWDCAICMVTKELGCKFYERGRTRGGLEPTPLNLLRAMRSWQIISPTGYSFDLYADPVSVITRGKVQLILHEDYGEDGITPARSLLLKNALAFGADVGVVACVKGHAAYGEGDSAHWVVIDTPETQSTRGMTMRDPLKATQTMFRYPKLYELCIYAGRRGAKRLFESIAVR